MSTDFVFNKEEAKDKGAFFSTWENGTEEDIARAKEGVFMWLKDCEKWGMNTLVLLREIDYVRWLEEPEPVIQITPSSNYRSYSEHNGEVCMSCGSSAIAEIRAALEWAGIKYEEF